MTHTSPSVTVIIVHHHGLEILQKCLDSLSKTKYKNYRIVLVDNGSRNGTSDFVMKQIGDNIDLLRSEVNLGFIRGNNLALHQIKSKYVMLLNDDTVVEPNWLELLVEVAENNPHVGVCQPKFLSLANPRYFEYSGGAGGMLDVYGVPFCRGRIFETIEEDKGQYDTIGEIFWACGGAILIRSEILNESGLLDETFFAHMGEIDLCWRIKLLGYKIMSVPFSVVHHLGAGTAIENAFYLKHRNNLFVLLKNYSVSSLLKYLPVRMSLDLIAFFSFIVKDVKRSICIAKAYSSLVRRLKTVIRNRYLVQQKRRVQDRVIIETMARKSVAVQYYLLGRKCFSQIRGLAHAR